MAVQPKPAHPQPEAAKTHEAAKDPQEAKLQARAAPPSWQEPKDAKVELRPDGPTIADQQRESSAKLEAEGMAKYLDQIDERPKDERGGKQVAGVAPPTKRE